MSGTLSVLEQSRRKVGEGHESRVNFVDELAVGFGFVTDTLPLRIVLEGFPVRRRGFAAGVIKDVDQRIALLRLIDRRPISDALDAMTVENLHRVIAEAGQQFWQFSCCGVIDAEFVDADRVVCGIGAVPLSPKRRGKECGRKCLEQCSSFHARDSNRRNAVTRAQRLVRNLLVLKTHSG